MNKRRHSIIMRVDPEFRELVEYIASVDGTDYTRATRKVARKYKRGFNVFLD